MKYRKKPIEIEAFQFYGDLINSDGELCCPKWAAAAYEKGILHYSALDSTSPPCELFIYTLEGEQHVSIGDYIIKGVKGELYPCKPDIFEATYERVEE